LRLCSATLPEDRLTTSTLLLPWAAVVRPAGGDVRLTRSSSSEADDLKELDMDLLDARASAQNRPLWRIIAKHGASTLP